jgi:hypothetical protein
MNPLSTAFWCVTLLLLAWLAHSSRLEIVIVHRLDLGSLVQRVPPETPAGPPAATTAPRPPSNHSRP